MIHLDSVNDTFGGQHQKQYGYELYFLLNYDNQLNQTIYLRKEECRRHWIIVASYAETPLGVSKWLVRKMHI